MTSLVELNSFTLGKSGVFACPDADTGVPYSDGDIEEEYIFQTVSSGIDLSSLSEDLRVFERDWASECHLSSKRANVFRALDFTGVKRILELGSGCGAITRFLGEQGGLVDAVEGSARRAEITRLRCRDLDNVSVIHADFNSLKLPDVQYDMVVLTGVVEYAGKFSDDKDRPEDAAVAMLKRIIPSLSPGGSVIIAIENRVGFKYLTGACEDHFSQPWVGVSNYPDCDLPEHRDKRGIRTWDKKQWQKMVDQLPGIACSWYYPFPDYKLATTLISEQFIRESTHAASSLSRVRSRDYTAMWYSSLDEQLFWQTVASAGVLEEMANSFVLILHQKDSSETMHASTPVPFDFVHFSGYHRKPKYRVMVQKLSGDNRVEKRSMFPCSEADENEVVVQHLEKEPYFEGQLLAVHWADVLRSCTASVTFDAILRQYYQYVVDTCKGGDSRPYLDLLPINIIVDEHGQWHHFDQEWKAKEDISPEFIFFRAILSFYWDNKSVLLSFCEQRQLRNGWDFVEYCLSRQVYSGEYDIQEFVRLENRIQKSISSREAFASVELILDSRPDIIPDSWSWEKTALIWGDPPTTTPPISSTRTAKGELVIFSLPAETASSPYLQLCLGATDREVDSVFSLHSFKLFGRTSDGRREMLFPEHPEEVMPSLMKLTGLTCFPQVRDGVFVVDDREPQVLHFQFPTSPVFDTCEFLTFDCEVVLEFLCSSGAQIRYDQSMREKQNLDVLLMESNHFLEETRTSLDLSKKHLNIAEQHLEERRNHIAQIEQSRSWKLILKLRMIKEKLKTLTELIPGVAKRQPVNLESENKQQDKECVADRTDCKPEALGNDSSPPVPHSSEERINLPDIDQDEMLSIILAVYNTGADELRQTVESVVSQSYKNWELILVDSCSTDGTTHKALAETKHPRIKVHYLKKSENLTRALGEGVDLASGTWVTFLGHFDRFNKDAFLWIVQELKTNQPDLLYFDEEIIGRRGDALKVQAKADFSQDILAQNDVIGSTLVIRRDLIRPAGGFDHEFDGVGLFDLAFRASKGTGNINHLDKVLYQTRQFEPPGQAEIQRKHQLLKSARKRS